TTSDALRVWDSATGRLLVSPMPGQGASEYATSSPDDRFILSEDRSRTTLRLWDLAAASPDRLGLPHAGAVYQAAFSPDGQMLATAENGKVRFWDAVHGTPLGAPLVHSEPYIEACQFSPDGRFVLTMSTGRGAGHVEAWIWDTAARKAVAGPLRHE